MRWNEANCGSVELSRFVRTENWMKQMRRIDFYYPTVFLTIFNEYMWIKSFSWATGAKKQRVVFLGGFPSPSCTKLCKLPTTWTYIQTYLDFGCKYLVFHRLSKPTRNFVVFVLFWFCSKGRFAFCFFCFAGEHFCTARVVQGRAVAKKTFRPPEIWEIILLNGANFAVNYDRVCSPQANSNSKMRKDSCGFG